MIEQNENQTRWEYNCLDISYTLEIAEILEQQMVKQPQTMQDFYHFQQAELAPALVNVMKRGVRVDLAKKDELKDKLSHLMKDVEAKLNWLIGEPFNPKSSTQVKKLFKDLLEVTPKKSKAGTDTFGAEAMASYLEDYPMLAPLITLILEYRTLQVFVGTFLSAQVDEDGRMRSSYNVAGTVTYRLASRKNAFGNGMNLQNVPSKGKIDLTLALARVDTGEDEFEGSEILNVVYSDGITKLPNCKQLFIPDPGYTFFDVDYSGADAMVVAWDSDCQWLMNFFTTQKQKLYCYLGEQYLQEAVTEKHPMYGKLKRFCHLTNYGGSADKAGRSCGMTKQEARELQRFYFKLCPEIPEWHVKLKNQVRTKGYIENSFGARGYFLNRTDPTLMNKVYAWIPQSSIGIMVNKGLVSIEKEANYLKQCTFPPFQAEEDWLGDRLAKPTKIEPIEVLMQVHDSLAGQFKTTDVTAPDRILKHMSIELPYKKPLVIPVDIATSTKSYGDC